MRRSHLSCKTKKIIKIQISVYVKPRFQPFKSPQETRYVPERISKIITEYESWLQLIIKRLSTFWELQL